MGDHVYGDQVYCTSVPADVIVVEVTNFVGIEWGITFTVIKFTVPLCLRVSLSSSY